MVLAIEHVALGHGKVFLRHQRHFHLVLDFLHAHSITNIHAREDVGEVFFGGKRADRKECFADGVFDFLNGERN